MSEQTFQIDGYPFRARQFPKPSINLALSWIGSRSKNSHAFDRGGAQDVYESEFILYDQEAYINAWQSNLDANARGVVALSGFGEGIFAPNVDHTSTVSAAMKSLGMRKALAFVAGGSEVYELKIRARAISPPLLATAPSMASLRVQHGWEADKAFEARTGFSYSQVPSTMDTNDDSGVYRGQFLQTTAELQAILAYITVTARGTAVALPAAIASAVPYPFGIVRGAGPFNCKITSVSMSRRDFMLWDLQITFVEHG